MNVAEHLISTTCTCGKAYQTVPENLGRVARCKDCGAVLNFSGGHAPVPACREARTGGHCVYCQSAIQEGDPSTACPDCAAVYHAECWEENGGCGVYGCTRTPETEARSALEIPASHWGSDDKQCPACNATIRAAAVRCRHCGAQFESANPEDQVAYRKRLDAESALPKLRTRTIWLFVFCVVPLTAPAAAILGAVWYRTQRENLAMLPVSLKTFCRIALGVAALQTLIGLLMALVFMAMNMEGNY